MRPASLIKINDGKELPFSFGMAALSNFLDSEGMTLQDLGGLQENLTLNRIMQIIHHGFRDGHRREKLPYTLTIDDVGDLLDDNPGLINECLDIFAKSMPNFAEGNGRKPTIPIKKKVG
jgi:hypothetical protein